jgi:hypothetical protein
MPGYRVGQVLFPNSSTTQLPFAQLFNSFYAAQRLEIKFALLDLLIYIYDVKRY